MNSLQYLSTQVDKVIGQAGTEPRKRLKSIQEEEPVVEQQKPEALVDDSTGKGTPNEFGSNSDIGSTLPSHAVHQKPGSIFSRFLAFIFGFFSAILRHITPRRLTRSSSYIDAAQLHLQSPSDHFTSKKHRRAQSSSSVDFKSKPAFTIDSNGPGSFSAPFGINSTAVYLPPPRPLLNKRYSKKTLVLDLDETLIHSQSRGSKFSAGHMVEVKLQNQLATLYFVNKRPFCDEFLRSVSQWYNLIVFTASVQAYADPMIDWLEREGKYFSQRFYRQHCTQTSNGSYVKDLSRIDTDLSSMIIIDNSPVSYSMHPKNAIAIEGWISDPSDHSLLYLVPLLQALRYTTDVRSFLRLKLGESALE